MAGLRVCCLSPTRIADDPRVRRQVDALLSAGHDVVAVGFGGGTSPSPSWPFLAVDAPSRSVSTTAVLALRLFVQVRDQDSAHRLFWSHHVNRCLRVAAEETGADLYIANDWRALPVAHAAASARGARFAYDSHELGMEEFAERPLWRAVLPRYIGHLERRAIADAAFVTTVSDGIADILQERYELRVRPLVVRNVPAYREMPLRPPHDPVRVLYHGQFLPNRGLESLVASVPRWRPAFSLHLRGSGPRRYQARLERLISRSPARDRITLHPPAPMVDLVPLANEADVGVHPLLPVTDQTRHSLPNKLFEYLMAGLALCVSDLPDMAAVVRRHQVGTVMRDTTPEAIAEAVNAIDPSTIGGTKARSLTAARELCWEREQARLVDAVAGVEVR